MVLRDGATRHAPAVLRDGLLPGRAPLTGSVATNATVGAAPTNAGGGPNPTAAPTTAPPSPAAHSFTSAAPANAVAVPVTTPIAPTVAALGVTVSETPAYRATLSRASVAPGPLRLQLQNQGEDDHDLKLLRVDDDTVTAYLDRTAPGRTRSTTVDVRPGTYRLSCTLQAPVVHATAGMSATLTVTG